MASATSDQTFDDMLAGVARIVPGFCGVSIAPDGSMELVMTNPAQAAAAQDAIRSVFGSDAFREGAARVRAGTYDFLQLKRWYDDMSTDVLAIAGVVFTDLDEMSNRLRIGVEKLDLKHEVEERLKNHSIPRDAFAIELTEPARDEVSLRDRHRPLVGGLQHNFGGFLCTIGFIANRAGVRGFVTNSHCSNVQGGTEGTIYHQHQASANANRVGLEVADPLWTLPGGSCPAGRCCRFSDASFERVPHPSGPATTSTLGRIARPALGSFAWNGADLFTILGKQVPAFMGEAITKVGRTTGRTAGMIIGTCLAVNGTSNVKCTDGSMKLKHVRCQAQGSYGSNSGDSGSPVFRFVSGNNVALLGIHWSSGGHFSTIDRIDSELSNLTIN